MFLRKEIIGDCTLFLGNCLEIMPTLGAVDHIICDPPYEKITQDKIGGLTRKDGVKPTEKLNFAAIDDIRADLIKLFESTPHKWNLCFCSPEGIGIWADFINKSALKYKKACAWIKPDAMPQLNGQCPASGFEGIVASWAGAGASIWNSGGKRGVYTHLTNQPDRTGLHPTEKPVPLMAELLSDFTNEGETILDPFMGSGTTGVACVRLARNFIGVELNQEYFDLSCRRIEQAYKQPDLFISTPARIKQESFF